MFNFTHFLLVYIYVRWKSGFILPKIDNQISTKYIVEPGLLTFVLDIIDKNQLTMTTLIYLLALYCSGLCVFPYPKHAVFIIIAHFLKN